MNANTYFNNIFNVILKAKFINLYKIKTFYPQKANR